MKFFSIDSKFYQVMMSVGEMMILNCCWILASLPLVTIGAANAAMYTVMRQRVRDEGSGTIVPFFKAWWRNLKQGCLFWLVQVFMTASLGMTLFMTLPLFIKIIAGVFLTLATLVFSLIYPQLARYRNRWFPYVRNAVILLVLRLKWVLLNFLVVLSPLLLFLLVPVEFVQFGFIWIVIGVSVLFYLSAKLILNVLQPLEDLAEQRR
jgi:uncharacterized membrane protein YesL